MSNRNRLYDILISVGATILLWGIFALLFDFRYDLNDDVLIKDIISGIYTGTPDAHNNQMLYPISLLFAGLYTSIHRIPWFGLFEIICMMGSFALIVYRLIRMCVKVWQKMLIAVILMSFNAGLMMWETVNVSYTVVAGTLTIAAAIWLYTGDTSLKKSIPAIILVILAFNIRSELVLLLSPVLAAIAIIKWCHDERRKDVSVIRNYLAIILSIGVLMFLSIFFDRLAYSSPEWREYRRFFNARTEVYDFTGIPDYDDNESFYSDAGITKDQYQLLMDYNYYLDDDIDADMLGKIADGVKTGQATGRNTYGKPIKAALWEYVHNTLDINSGIALPIDSKDCLFADESNQHKPFNLIVVILYMALLVLCLMTADLKLMADLVILAVLRSIPWIYIYLKGRVLSRITHPLYMIEIIFLFAMIVEISHRSYRNTGVEGKKTKGMMTSIVLLVCALLGVLCILITPLKYEYLTISAEEREKANISYEDTLEEIRSHPDTYYYLDTYSTVDWTEKIFTYQPYSKKNMQLLGGWMGNSPLDTEKRSADFDKTVIKK